MGIITLLAMCLPLKGQQQALFLTSASFALFYGPEMHSHPRGSGPLHWGSVFYGINIPQGSLCGSPTWGSFWFFLLEVHRTACHIGEIISHWFFKYCFYLSLLTSFSGATVTCFLNLPMVVVGFSLYVHPFSLCASISTLPMHLYWNLLNFHCFN